jgi:ABC-2 type transport system permease protein
VGTIVVLAAGGLGIGLAYGVVVGDAGQIPRMVGAALATVPAVLVLVGIAVALFGIVPRAAVAAWAGLVVAVVVSFLGELLQLPQWSRQVSPLHHVPAVPAEDLRILPLAVLAGVAAVLVVAGLHGFRTRDLRTE